MNPLVSVIMPVYNAEARIEGTVHSLQRQTYHPFELILIDDGSTDRTGLLCDSFAEMYHNIKVLHENNEGPGKAREKGITIAKGDIIAFLDSDDYLSEETLEVVVLKMKETGSDIVQFSYKIVNSNGNVISEHTLRECSFDSCMDSYKFFISQDNCTNYLWNKVFKSSMFHDVKWPKIFYSEDYVVLAQLYAKASKIVTIKKNLYYYVQHDENAVNKPFSERKMDQIVAGKYVVEFTRNNYPDFLPESLYYLATRSARLSESIKQSNLENKHELYNTTVQTFRSAYSEMKQVLKKQKRSIKLDKMTKIFAFSPTLALCLKKFL